MYEIFIKSAKPIRMEEYSHVIQIIGDVDYLSIAGVEAKAENVEILLFVENVPVSIEESDSCAVCNGFGVHRHKIVGFRRVSERKASWSREGMDPHRQLMAQGYDSKFMTSCFCDEHDDKEEWVAC